MKKWNTPVLEMLNVSMTENGAVPATYEADGSGHMDFGGTQWCVVSGFLWESGMDMKGYTAIERPYLFTENGTIYYEG